MGKCSIVLVVLGFLLVVDSVSAQPFFEGKGLENVMMMMTDGLNKLTNGRGTEIIEAVKNGVRGIMERIGGLFGGKGGGAEGARRKRSIQSSFTVTNMNKTNYHKVEINHSSDKDHEKKTQSNCLVKENEIYWLEFMTSQLINVLGEIKKVLDGKVIPYQMSKDAYNRTGS